MWQYSITKLSLRCPIWKWKHLKLVETPKIHEDPKCYLTPHFVSNHLWSVLDIIHECFPHCVHVPKNGNNLRVIKRHAKGLFWLQRRLWSSFQDGVLKGPDILMKILHKWWAWYQFPTQSDGSSASWGDSGAAAAAVVAAWFSTLRKRGLQSSAILCLD